MAKRLVYLDNAATTPVRPEVLEAMLPYLGKDAFGNPSSPHRFGRAARAGVEEAKRTIALALGVEPGHVIFTSGGTEADNLAGSGSALAARDGGRPFRAVARRTSPSIRTPFRRSARSRSRSGTSAVLSSPSPATRSALPRGSAP